MNPCTLSHTYSNVIYPFLYCSCNVDVNTQLDVDQLVNHVFCHQRLISLRKSGTLIFGQKALLTSSHVKNGNNRLFYSVTTGVVLYK